jgi:hypothetical protein
MAGLRLARLAFGPGHRQAGNRDWLAPQGVGIENSKVSVGMEAAPDIGTEMPVEAITMGSRNVQQQAL